MRYFKIGNIRINKKTPPVIIAEIGINHNGNLIEAIKITDEAGKMISICKLTNMVLPKKVRNSK